MTNSQTQVWLARNLGIIAAVIIAAVIAIWPLETWTKDSFSIEHVLLSAGLFLLVCYWRYPRLPFQMDPLLFWMLSAGFVPFWLLVCTPWLFMLGEFMIVGVFILAHAALSLAGLVTYFCGLFPSE